MMHKAWGCIEEVPYCFSRPSIKFEGHTGQKIADFDLNWAFLDCNSSLNLLMAIKWCTTLEAANKRCPIYFQGHPSNFNVTRDQKSPILTQIGRFRTVTPVWIDIWRWNEAQSLMLLRRSVLLFFKVIRQIARSHGLKKSSILTRIERFQAVTPVWIHWWLWNNAQSLTQYRRGAL